MTARYAYAIRRRRDVSHALTFIRSLPKLRKALRAWTGGAGMQLLKRIKKRLGGNPCAADGCHRNRDHSVDQRYPFCKKHDWYNGAARSGSERPTAAKGKDIAED